MNLIPIIYQTSEIFIINKKAGMAVQGGEKIHHSLDEELAKQVGHKVYLVHRLDKDTAGLMIVAKTPAAASKWTKLIAGKEVKKEYIAICAGRINPEKGEITEDIVQHGQKKRAVTHYQVEKEWEIEGVEGLENVKMCRIRLQLETGRMHQIRIHLAKQGCPIAGDDQHGNFKLNKLLRKLAGIKQLQLFSAKLTLPIDGSLRIFELDMEQI